MINSHDTIIALASARGRGSIAIIRLSGRDSISLVNKSFKGKDLSSIAGNTIHFGGIFDQEQMIDQVLVAVFREPHSYTGENSVEISCHANPLIIDNIINILVKQGARLAKPGEFTFRAFMNGKMSLTQAEAVAELVSTKSIEGIRNSLRQLNGELNSKLDEISNNITDIRSLLEATLDFPEEDDISIVQAEDIIQRLKKVESEVKQLVESYNYAKILSGSITVTIMGRTNVGKSTLMNALLGEDRVITSNIPGTTRDIIHEDMIINDIHFKLIDTAGLRDTINDIEVKGIEKTIAKIETSDLLLWVIDHTDRWPLKLFDQIKSIIKEETDKIIIVINKCDQKTNLQTEKVIKKAGITVVKTSALKGTGIKKLKITIIKKIAFESQKLSEDLIITNLRQKKILDQVIIHTRQARKTIEKERGYEFASVDLRQAAEIIGEITGETTGEQILDRIFANFCIGK
jgi:tRNA modification GTPase